MNEKIVLKSTNPDKYEDLVVECKVIPNDKIGEYLESIPEEKKFSAYKTGEVLIRKGIVGKKIKTVLTTVVDDKEYVLHEEEGTVERRTYTKEMMIDGNINRCTVTSPDYVITNFTSPSNEQYIVKAEKIEKIYDPVQATQYGWLCSPKYDCRVVTQVDENIIIITAWGAPAVCLKGSYIVTYNALENDYNVIEKGAFDSTYTVEKHNVKRKKRNFND